MHLLYTTTYAVSRRVTGVVYGIESTRLSRDVLHARNAVAEMRSALKTVKSADVQDVQSGSLSKHGRQGSWS